MLRCLSFRRSELAREQVPTGGFGVMAWLRPLSPALSLKGEGACPCREKEWFQPETFGVAG